jgi:hypothetical protein
VENLPIAPVFGKSALNANHEEFPAQSRTFTFTLPEGAGLFHGY